MTGLSLKERFALLPAGERERLLASFDLRTLQEMARGEWWWTSRPDQVPPPGDWLIYLVLSGRGWGKALAVDTPVRTSSGWSTMGEVSVGDQVPAASGGWTDVQWVSPIQLGGSCFRITFGDGATVVADADHQWWARRSDEVPYRCVQTREMVSSPPSWSMPTAGFRSARTVVSVEPTSSVAVRCIGVDHPSKLFLAGVDDLVTHNSRSGSEWIVQRTLDHPKDTSGAPTERLIIAEKLADVKDVCIGGPSGVLRVLERRGIRYRYTKSPQPQIRFLDTGCVIHGAGADDADVGRGYNASDVWLDEFAKWPMPAAAWTEGIMPSLRADIPGDHPRAYVTTTPKPIKILREWSTRKDGTVLVVRGSTFDNRANLSKLILGALETAYAGTSIGEQELHGVLLDDAVGRTFSQADINTARHRGEAPPLEYIVVGVDPGLTGEDDETGIVVVGADREQDWYILADRTIMGVGREAALHAWRVFAEFGAKKLVVETNLGRKWMTESFTDAYNELVTSGLLPRGNAPIETIDAKAGKKTRAEPIGMRCEQHRLHMVGVHRKLEEQMIEFDPDGKKDSPDRVDALVHACRFLMKLEKRRVSIATPTSILEKRRQVAEGLPLLDRFDDLAASW